LYAIPYLTLFVIPNWQNIRAMIAGVQGTGGPIDAYLRHLRSYEAFSQRIYWNPLINYWNAQLLTTLINYPVLQWKIPAIFVAVVPLLISPYTRLLAIAGSILPLFVLFYSQGKQVGYTGYFTPEFILYFSGILIGIFSLIEWGLNRVRATRLRDFTAIAATTVLTLLVFTGVPTSMGPKIRLVPSIISLDIARAAGREIVGSNALVGNNSAGIWYTSGATHWYQPWTDLTYPKYQSVDLPKYFAHFDALAIDSAYWNNKIQNVPMPLWYTQKLLKLKGFFFQYESSFPWISISPSLMQSYPSLMQSYLFFNDKPLERVVGYGYRDKQLYRFDQESGGDYTYYSMKCPSRQSPSTPVDFFSGIYMDDPIETAPLLYHAIVKRKDYEGSPQVIPATCQLIDRVDGRLQEVDKRAFLDQFHQNDQTIRFYSTLEAAIAGRRNS